MATPALTSALNKSTKRLLSSKKDEVLSALQLLTDELNQIDQSIDAAAVPSFPAKLLDTLACDKLIAHKDADIRLLTATALADILRLSAPDPPFDSRQLPEIFSLLLHECAGIRDVDAPSYHRRVYLIERLAAVRSFVLLPELTGNLLSTFFDAVVEKNGARVVRHVLDMLVAALGVEESGRGDANAEHVALVVDNLVEPRRSERPAAYRLARSLVQRCPSRFQHEIARYLIGRMPGADMDDGEAPDAADKKDVCCELVLELAAASPETVAPVLPQLVQLAASAEERIRLQITELLANLLLLPGLDLSAPTAAQLVKSFVGRMNDVAPLVRLAAVEHSPRVLLSQPSLATPLTTALELRVRDVNDSVRQGMVAALCAGAQLQFSAFAPLLAAAANRMGDKSPGVRKASRDGLCALYCKQATTQLVADETATTVSSELGCIPQQFFHCYSVDARHDVASKLELEGLLDTALLPKDEGLRLRTLCAIHAVLQPSQRRALRMLLKSKRDSQAELVTWLDLQAELKAAGLGGNAKSKELTAERARVATGMCARLPDKGPAKEIWEAIGKAKDQKLGTQLRVLASGGSSLAELTKARDELFSRVAPRVKEAHKPLVRTIGSLYAMTVLWPEGVETLLGTVLEHIGHHTASEERGGGQATSSSAAELSGRAAAILEMLSDVARSSPETFGTAGPSLAAALQAACQADGPSKVDDPAGGAPAAESPRRPALLLLLRLVQIVSPQLLQADVPTRKLLVSLLCRLCCTCRDAEAGKLAAQALSSQLLAASSREKTFGTLLGKLAPALESFEKPTSMQPCAIAVLGALAKRDITALGPAPRRQQLLQTLLDAALPTADGAQRPDARRKKSPCLQARCTAQLLAIKALANAAIGMRAAAPQAGDAVRGSAPPPPSGGGAPKERAALEMADDDAVRAESVLAERLLGALHAAGKVGAAAEAGAKEHSEVRLVAGCALLKLIRVPTLRVEALLGARGWHKLAQLMHDPASTVRARFCEKLVKESMRHVSSDKRETNLGAPVAYQATRRLGLPPQFLAVLALAALDPDEANVLAAKRNLGNLAGVWRACANRSNQPRVLPEAQLPWLIHLLAHHPDCKKEAEDDDEMEMEEEEEEEEAAPDVQTSQSVQRCLDLFVSACLAGSTKGIETLRSACAVTMAAVDKLDPHSVLTRAVTAAAQRILEVRSSEVDDPLCVSSTVLPPGLLFYKPRRALLDQGHGKQSSSTTSAASVDTETSPPLKKRPAEVKRDGGKSKKARVGR